ncbi:MAG TPA: type II secretion system protein GspK [Candidatus Acidoferrum sp.]|jgi:type II secretory pathway component PulK|nr:type II secretion system protein GspK [Candidatus Acidoferrum sp.]
MRALESNKNRKRRACQAMHPLPERSRRGSVLIIVLWIAFGLVALALYFANAMNFELRASDNRVSAQAADQAIEGAARYVNYLLSTQIQNGSNGYLPTLAGYQCEAVPVGDAHFWLIGRDTNNPIGPGTLSFGLVDEASKLNLNIAPSNAITWLPRMTVDLTQAILDWRDTNANGPTVTYYAMQQPSYQCKSDPFETVDELRLLYGSTMDILVGEDANRNGVLDPTETDENQNNMVDPGLVEYFTVYSREPNTNSDGSQKVLINPVNVNALRALLQTNFPSKFQQVLTSLGVVSAGGPGRGTNNRPAIPINFASPLRFFLRSGLTSTEFSQIATNLTTASGAFIEGRVNVNTASATVLTCLLEGDASAAQTLVSYRLANPNNLTSIGWVLDALGQNFPNDLQMLEAGDYITTQSYQFTADIAALGPHGRGYRRVKFVFDTSGGTPQIVYRQDLTHLGWALGKEAREKWLLAKGT